MIRTDAQLLHMSGPINDVDENVTEGLIGGIRRHPASSCSGVAVEYTDRRGLVIGDFVQTHVLEPLSCQLLDLPEQGSFAPSGRSNRHLHGASLPSGGSAAPVWTACWAAMGSGAGVGVRSQVEAVGSVVAG